MSTFFTILTKVGEAKLANATALGQTVKFAKLAIGDGNGQLPTPNQNQTALVRELRREPLNLIDVDDQNPNWIICEQVIPENVGGWTIREIGIYDVDGDLIAVGNFPETYKPVLEEGSGRTQTIRVVLQVSSTASVELKIDPSVVLATRKYVDDLHNSLVTAVDPFPQYGRKDEFYFSFHFQRAAILLVPYAEASTRFDESFVTGRLTMRRGSKQFSERLGDYEISVKSSYNQTSFTMMVHRRGWAFEFCKLQFEGQMWLALYDANAEWFNSQDAYVTFSGERALKEASYNSENQFKVISFASSQEGTSASNPEVFETIVPLETHNPADAKGNQFYSKNYTPVIGNVDGLSDALASKLPVDSLVGSIVEFSTDQPRAGYVKAQRVELSRLAYPKLWAVVQAASNLTAQALIDANPKSYAGHYGTGDGVSTFTTPDYHLGHYRRGVRDGELFAATLKSAVEFHTHGLPTSAAATSNPVSYGIPDASFVAVDHFNDVLPGGYIAVTSDNGKSSAGQIGGNFAEETRPETLTTHVFIFHGELA